MGSSGWSAAVASVRLPALAASAGACLPHDRPGAPPFFPGYRSLRLRCLARPFSGVEAATEARVAAALACYLGSDRALAGYHARRAVLWQRERRLHEWLLLEAPPTQLEALLQTMPTPGLPALAAAAGRGLVLLALHYSVFSSLLCLQVARAAARGILPPVTMLFDSGRAGSLGLSEQRLAALEAAGLGAAGTTTLLDVRSGPLASRRLVTALRRGEAVLLFPDGCLHAASPPAALRLTVGRRAVGLPRGAAWLVEESQGVLATLAVAPEGDRFALRAGPLVLPHAGGARAVEALLQELFERVVLPDPAPWDGWRSLPLVGVGGGMLGTVRPTDAMPAPAG